MSNEANYSFTTKVGADLLTVRGDTFDEFTTNAAMLYNVPAIKFLMDTLNGSISEITAVATIESAFGPAITTSAAPAFAMSAPVASMVTVAPPANPVAGGGKVCVHGTMSRREGTGKDGKTWRGYMCSAPQGATDKCKNVYIYPNSPEWHTFVAG